MTETGCSSMCASNNGMEVHVLFSAAESAVQTFCQECMCRAVHILAKQ